jgi:protein-S-isoprenylcysteine O-methyltransferase Ste14
MATVFVALRTVCYMAGFILFFGWFAVRFQAWDESLKIPLPAWTRVVGVAAETLGAFIVSACAVIFVARGRGTPAIFDPPRKFVATGPYKFVRNPMYIGGSMLLIGFGLYRQSLAILLYSAVIMMLFHLYVVFIEEPGLESRFGKSYFAYKQSVNRWLPKFSDGAHAAP